MGNPAKVHAMVISLGRKRAALDHELGRRLVAAYRLRVHESLGFASFAEYVERYCGCSRREATERLRVAKALDELPELSHALRTGQVCWSACRELSRVATAETERDWLDAALGCRPGSPRGRSSPSTSGSWRRGRVRAFPREVAGRDRRAARATWPRSNATSGSVDSR